MLSFGRGLVNNWNTGGSGGQPMRAMAHAGSVVVVVCAAAGATGIVISFTIHNAARAGDIGRASMTLLMMSLLTMLYRVLHQIRAAVQAPQKLREADYDAGYRAGHMDGRREGRPVVVPFRREAAGG